MNDEYISDLLKQGFSDMGMSSGLQQMLLEQSSHVLSRSYQRRARIRRLCRVSGLFVVLVLGFAGGRFYNRPEPTIATTPTGGATVAVPQDTLTWLQAARLFHQLGMDQRATRAYRQAHLLTKTSVQSHATSGGVSVTDASQQRVKDTYLSISNPIKATHAFPQPLMAQSMGEIK